MASYPCYLFFTRNMCPCVLPSWHYHQLISLTLQCESRSVSQLLTTSTYQVISELFGDGKDLRSAKLFMSASNLWIPLVLGLPFFGSPNCGNW